MTTTDPQATLDHLATQILTILLIVAAVAVLGFVLAGWSAWRGGRR